jgi:hypothetical protein
MKTCYLFVFGRNKIKIIQKRKNLPQMRKVLKIEVNLPLISASSQQKHYVVE